MSPLLQAVAVAGQSLFHGAQALCKPECLPWFILPSPGDLRDKAGLWPAHVPERGSHVASDWVQMRVRILMVDFAQVAPGALPQFPHLPAGVITLASLQEDSVSSGSVNASPVEFSFGAVPSVLRCASRCRRPAGEMCGSVSTVFWSWELVGRLEGPRLWCPLEGEPGKPAGEMDGCVCRDPPPPPRHHQEAVGAVIQQAQLLCSSHVTVGLTWPICKMGSVSQIAPAERLRWSALGTLACGPCLRGCVPEGERSHAYGTEGAEKNVPGHGHGDPSFRVPCRSERCFLRYV